MKGQWKDKMSMEIRGNQVESQGEKRHTDTSGEKSS